ncbi:ribosome maturation factor RimP [Marinibactrum halimedae]|uniref:Ribosome maturation factor RimP n=1 Tax=Marinibactrum halimedae TaxID=1444977 RepID=A0AA37WMZ1_9GAMM|nr:ribosome maturation factor RimP [Marinibactrum halimedae]MCD9459002.1 ribosome maturation factor RimP [Marinibactrum halimedae]GLS26868.1 ribosome maturation factor RimP [Marinibactrum halimedae]
MTSQHQKLNELLRPAVEALSCEFWGLEYFTHGKNTVLRLYIDKDGGVGIEDCEKVSRQVSSILDVEDPIVGEFTLEVSSPGADRTLFTLDQYHRFIGETVSIKLRVAFEGRRKFSGVLAGVEGEDVILVVGDEEYLLPIDSIDKANIVPRF